MDRFWTERLAAHGHTGWSDNVIYRFDQTLRLAVFKRFLQHLKPGVALDFGCGVGDFSSALLRKGWRVVAYDKFVPLKFSHDNLFSTCERGAIDGFGPFDLVVSITVLDAILADQEFENELKSLRSVLVSRGEFFFIEYSAEQSGPRNHYQSFRTMQQWQSALEEAGLKIANVEPFFHPYTATVPAWNFYRNSLVVRGLERLERMWGTGKVLNAARDVMADLALRSHPYSPPATSTLNLIVGSRV